MELLIMAFLTGLSTAHFNFHHCEPSADYQMTMVERIDVEHIRVKQIKANTTPRAIIETQTAEVPEGVKFVEYKTVVDESGFAHLVYFWKECSL